MVRKLMGERNTLFNHEFNAFYGKIWYACIGKGWREYEGFH